MTETLVVPAEVGAFVEQVRHHLRDLPSDERQELTEGLEADLTERVSEHGHDLGDPALYAAELRAAAGLERRRRLAVRPSVAGVDSMLDRCHERWDQVISAVPGGVAGLLEALRPVWWVARAWVAVELIDFYVGGFPHGWIPTMFGPLGWALTVVAVLVSVQLGRGVLPLGPVGGTARRWGLLVLNVLAALALVPMASVLPSGADVDAAYSSGIGVVPHLAFNSNQVRNVYPYDANGQPLTGVQLVDQDGQRLSVAGELCQRYWTNGTKKVYSAFPVPTRTDDNDGTCSGPTTITFPLASLPPVSLPASVAAAATGQTPAP